MAIAFVNSTTGSSDGGSSTIAATAANHTTGNLIVVGVVWSGNRTVSQITDTAGNTYVSTGQKADNGTSDHTEVWYAKNVTGNASNVVTATFSASATFRRIMVLQYSGCDTTAPLDTGGKAVGTSGTATTSSFSTGTADEVICTFVGSSGAGNTWGAGAVGTARVTNLGTDSGCEDNIVSSTGSYTGSMTRDTGSPTWFVAAASFKAASSGTQVTAATGLSYDIINSVLAARGLSYDISNSVLTTRALSYDILNAVLASRALSYDISNSVQAQTALSYDILNSVLAAMGLSYDILAPGSSQVTTARALNYDIQAAVQLANALSYDILNAVTAARALNYDILNAVTAARALNYDIQNNVSLPTHLYYDIGNVVVVAVAEFVSASRASVWQPDVHTIGRRR